MFERSRYMTGYFPTKDPKGNEILLVVVRRTYTVDLVEGICAIADAQDEVTLGDMYTSGDNPFQSSVRLESELAPWKVHKDIVFLGKAYAPKGKAAKTWDVSMQVGSNKRTLRIFGPRSVRWTPPKGKKEEPQPPVIGAPDPVKEVELTYENAYGGFATFYPKDPRAYRRAVRQSRKKTKEKEAKEKAEAAAAAQAADEEAKAEAVADAKRRESQSIESHFMGADRLIENAPDVPIEVEIGSAHHKHRDGTIVLDTAEIAEAEAREQSEKSDESNESPPAEKVSESTQMIDAEELAALAAEDTDSYFAELKKKQTIPEEGTRALDLLALGDHVVGSESWIQDEKSSRDEFYRTLGKDPDEEVVWEEGEFPRIPCPTNPVGKGFALGNSKEALDQLPMPMVEDPKQLLQPEDLARDPATLHLAMPVPAGFGFISRGWMPRSMKAGYLPDELEEAQHQLDKQLVEGDFNIEDEDDQKNIDALLAREASVMQTDYYNGAHPMWQVPSLQGDEEVMLTNLDANGKTYFKLPGHKPLVRLRRGDGWENVAVDLDTLVVDREEEKVHLVWRGKLPFGGEEELASYPLVDIDVQDLSLNEWQEKEHEKAIADMAKDGATAMIDIDALSDEEKVAFDTHLEQAGIGLHGIKEVRSSSARETQGEDGALIDRSDDEDVIISDKKWVGQAKDKLLTEEERKALEIQKDERKAVESKKKALRKQRKDQEKKKEEEEAKKSKRTKKKDAKAKEEKLSGAKGKKSSKKNVEPDEDDVPLTEDKDEKKADKAEAKPAKSKENKAAPSKRAKKTKPKKTKK